jgi:hypothetical protein
MPEALSASIASSNKCSFISSNSSWMIKTCNKCSQTFNRTTLHPTSTPNFSHSCSSTCSTKESILSSSRQTSVRIKHRSLKMCQPIIRIHFRTSRCKGIARRHQLWSQVQRLMAQQLLQRASLLYLRFQQDRWALRVWSYSNNLIFYKSCSSRASKTNWTTDKRSKANLKINNKTET